MEASARRYANSEHRKFKLRFRDVRIGDISWVLTQRPSMGVMSSSYREARDGVSPATAAPQVRFSGRIRHPNEATRTRRYLCHVRSGVEKESRRLGPVYTQEPQLYGNTRIDLIR